MAGYLRFSQAQSFVPPCLGIRLRISYQSAANLLTKLHPGSTPEPGFFRCSLGTARPLLCCHGYRRAYFSSALSPLVPRRRSPPHGFPQAVGHFFGRRGASLSEGVLSRDWRAEPPFLGLATSAPQAAKLVEPFLAHSPAIMLWAPS